MSLAADDCMMAGITDLLFSFCFLKQITKMLSLRDGDFLFSINYIYTLEDTLSAIM